MFKVALWLSLLIMAGAQIAQARAVAKEPGPFDELEQLLVMEANSGTILWEKAADKIFNPGALAKLMTAKLIFDAVKSGKLSLDQQFYVSDYAWKTGGAPSKSSTMFAAYHSYISVKNLLLGLIIDHANDAALILAEGYMGSHEAFVSLMNEEAKNLGLKSTHFITATGMNASEATSSLFDMVKLLSIIIKEYPQFYSYYRYETFLWNKIRQRNKNPLSSLDYVSEFGLFGYNKERGYSLLAVVNEGGMRLIIALSPIKDRKKIAGAAHKLIKQAIDNFHEIWLFPAQKPIASASVFGGVVSKIPLALQKPLNLWIENTPPHSLKAQLVYQGPLFAPVAKDACLAELQIYRQRRLILSRPLCTMKAAAKAGLWRQARSALYEITLGWLRAYIGIL